MFESIFSFPSVIQKHRQAPLLVEREQYLHHLLRQGYSTSSLRARARYMLHAIRVLDLKGLWMVRQEEIEAGAQFWESYRGQFRESRNRLPGSPLGFLWVARAWLKFHGRLEASPELPFLDLVREFSEAMRSIRGLSSATIRGYGSRAHAFLRWYANRSDNLQSPTLRDVDEYLTAKRADGWSPRSLASQCQALRTFLGFAETQRWCAPGIPLGIRSPRIPKYSDRPKGPSWSEVRQLLRTAEGEKPSDLRAKAILLLLAIYGLRSSEVSGLRLDDFDWRSETFAVRRAKRGGIQHYPIQYEVGEAILAYLQRARPRVPSRNVFLSLSRPYGPIHAHSMWQIVASRMRDMGVELDQLGPHSLRHACATRLLQRGTALKEIADFLGHRNVRSVGIYAKYDMRGLRKVAAFRLAGLQ